jgi:putative FmdB family regulatory protein
MPTYHYRCKSCKNEFEELQKMSDDPLKVCPSCHKHTLVRLFSGGGGLVFKGSGFYITDYKGKSPSTHHKETPVEKKPESTTESKLDKKSSDSASPKENPNKE